MILSKGRGCGDVGLVGKSKEPAGRPSLLRASRPSIKIGRQAVRNGRLGLWGSFLLVMSVLIGRFDARILLGADSLEDAKEIGAAVWSCAGVGEMNDGSLATGVGYEWIGASSAYSPKEISV